jgi:hypothetical protein
MKIIAFITEYPIIDKIIHHLVITFTAKRPPPATRQEELYRSIAPAKPITGITLPV